jgi:FlgN protein
VISEVAVGLAGGGLAAIDTFTLADALETECRLLGDLRAVLQRQREGVASDDATAVDDSVIAAHRVMRTLDEARKQRRAVIGILAADEDTPLTDLDTVLGARMTPRVATAATQLQSQAKLVAREIDVNRRILRAAMEQGDRFMKALCGAPAKNSYEPAKRMAQAPSHSGSLINQSV